MAKESQNLHFENDEINDNSQSKRWLTSKNFYVLNLVTNYREDFDALLRYYNHSHIPWVKGQWTLWKWLEFCPSLVTYTYNAIIQKPAKLTDSQFADADVLYVDLPLWKS